MIQRMILTVAICTVWVAMSITSHAAAFIKFDGVDGEAQDKDHKGWSDVLSFSQTIHRTKDTTDPTRPRGNVILEDIMITKELDKSSPKLAEAICTGKHFPKVEVHLTASYTDAGRVTYYIYELRNVQVVNYSISGATRSQDRPMETLSLNFEEIKVTYVELDERGSEAGRVEYSWKVEEGTTVAAQTIAE